MGSTNFSVREAEALRPRLREGLTFSIQEQGERRVCVIEDTVASKFHRVGLAEYRFIRALDGRRTVAGILASLAREGRDGFTDGEALQILRWLHEQRLLIIEGPGGTSERENVASAMRFAATWLNPLVCKIPLFQPDRFFSAVEPALRFALGWGGFVLWLVVVLFGTAQVGMDWSRFAADTHGILARDNWLWLFVAWTGMKVIHEFSHGVFCKHFGAAVREAGVILVIFVPMGFVDATASIGLASSLRRITVSAAGVYAEFFVAALAAVVWARTDAGVIHTVAHNMIIVGTVVTLLFNANPLMRFDGYFILSDVLDIPNLATRGRMWAQRALSALFLGGKAGGQLWPTSHERWVIAIYGIAASLWQIAVLGGMLLAASVTMRGGGLLLAVGGAVVWVAVPVFRFFSQLTAQLGHAGASWPRAILRVTALIALVAAIIFVPWHKSVSSDGVVEWSDTQTLRADCPGFVLQELVKDGEVVAEGQLLLQLGNDEAEAELARRKISLEQQELRARLAYMRDDIATFQAEQAKTVAFRQEVAEHERFLKTLQVRAPFAGRVSNYRLGHLQGAFFRAGDEMLRIGRADGSEVKIAVSERDEPHFRTAVGNQVQIRVSGRGATFTGHLARLEARATRDLPHPALTASADGPLPLRPTESKGQSDNKPAYELVDPHFTAVAEIDNGLALFPGELARVKLRSSREVTLWSELQSRFAAWVQRHMVEKG